MCRFTKKYSLASSPVAACIKFTQGKVLAFGVAIVASMLALDANALEITSYQVTATIDKSSVEVAEPFSYTISVIAPDDATVRFPRVAESIGQFNVRGSQNQFDIPIDQGRQWRRTYELDSYESGQLQIPAMDVVVNGQVERTKPLQVVVSSVLEGNSDPTKFRAIKGPVEIIPNSTETYVGRWIGGGAVLLMMLGVAAVFLIRSKRKVAPAVIAKRQLSELRHTAAYSAGDVRSVLPPLVDILRKYIQQGLSIPASQQTTPEFLRQIQTDERFDTDRQMELKSILDQADSVKFANATGAMESIDLLFGKVSNFIEATALQNRTQKPLGSQWMDRKIANTAGSR